ncbi:CRP-like cAMP-activated global transcriptional regulator [Fundidesulfovibrio magnetotacticus]|uniref:CRP-like cAMP-activated global transcriptional regulator n=1 Tax=Fundidesulfovibrio magnetotacticus TaxID=2730080 RepID=A0A6V8LQ44_9BACT|nr:Crp/Fnr family transcriptional regulator [Fundidesulfovibrio magnetotacticus]GFK93854.1 CRP-like cAMP-activated global transcriptional regulator [Fundidesulfovibrio magnetotacticus]
MEKKSPSTLSILAKAPLFSGLSPAQLATLENNSAVLRLDKGQVVFFEGAEAKGLYVLLSGQVKIYKSSSEGKEQILHVLGPGEPFAEVPMFQGTRFPANAMAIQPSSVLYLEKSVLTRLMERDAGFAMAMLAALSQRLRQMATMIGQLTLREVPARLAAYLLHQSEGKDSPAFDLDMSKGHLAGFLGATREALSRALARLEDQGYITMRGRNITIEDFERLRELSEGETRLK